MRFSSIGDIVLTTPIIRCIKEQTGATVHFLTKSPYAPILTSNPRIDQVHVFNQSTSEILTELRQMNFTYVVDLHNNHRTRILRQRLGIPYSAFPKLNLQKWIAVQTGVNFLGHRHVVARYFLAAAALGVLPDQEGLEFYIPEEFDQSLDERTGGMVNQPYLALVLGAAHKTKQMPEFVVNQVINQINHPIILLGGQGEAAMGQRLAATHGHVWNGCGVLHLYESAAILRDARVVITPDTGMMHIAAAFQKPILSVWGNTIPEFGMSPYVPGKPHLSRMFFVPGLPCRPCSKIGFPRCPRGHFNCMMKIPVDALVQAAGHYFG